MPKFSLIHKLFLFPLLICAFAARASSPADTASAQAWASVPDIISSITQPQFPHRKFRLENYGAIGDGTNDCTVAFRKAIDDCSSAGGGEVIVPRGTFLTGAIHLKSNVNLHVERGATILFTTNREEYLPVVFVRYEGTEVMNYSPLVYAFEQTNIAITGEGTLNGQGWSWLGWRSNTDPRLTVQMATQGKPLSERVFGDKYRLRPNFVVPFRCKDVLIEGVHIVNSPMWVLNPVYCTNVTVRDVIVNTLGANTDGCDPDSCNGVWIKNDDFSDGDDCISVKSGRDADGQKINIPCENVVIQDCLFRAGHGGVALGSETSGGIQNVFTEHCHFDSTNLEMAIRLKTNPARGGYIKDIYVRNCVVKVAQVGIHMTLRYSSSGAMEGGSIPVISNVDIRNTTFKDLTVRPVFIQGWSPSNPITDVSIVNCRFLQAREKSYVTNATDIVMDDSRGY
jgi:polygalacturonase